MAPNYVICITVIEPSSSTAHESVFHSRHAIIVTAIIGTGCKEGGQSDPQEGRGKRVWSWPTGTGKGTEREEVLITDLNTYVAQEVWNCEKKCSFQGHADGKS
jgi:hypothetical protein